MKPGAKRNLLPRLEEAHSRVVLGAVPSHCRVPTEKTSFVDVGVAFGEADGFRVLPVTQGASYSQGGIYEQGALYEQVPAIQEEQNGTGLTVQYLIAHLLHTFRARQVAAGIGSARALWQNVGRTTPTVSATPHSVDSVPQTACAACGPIRTNQRV